MRTRVALLISLGLNLALGLWLYFQRDQPATAPAESPVTTLVNGPGKPGRTNVVVRRLHFRWNEIESDDYQKYIQNLRAIGCPEKTIRDIIVADVDEMFARRRATEIITPEQQWWRSEPDPDVMEAATTKFHQLEAERGQLLAALLGPNWDGEPKVDPRDALPLDGPILGTLSPEIRDRIYDIETESKQRAEAYAAEMKKQGLEPDPAHLAQLRQLTRNSLAQILTGEQLEEYLLRYSHNANTLRQELAGFNASPEEFRQIFRARDALDQQIQMFFAKNDPISEKRRQELESVRDAAIKQALGPERHSYYQYSKDPLFRDAQSIAQEVGAPPEKVLPLYEINQATIQERRRIENDPDLTLRERNEALEAMQLQQRQSIRKILGDEAYAEYVKNNPDTAAR